MHYHRSQQATSVVELSLNSLFRRDHNSLYKGIQEFLPPQFDKSCLAFEENIVKLLFLSFLSS